MIDSVTAKREFVDKVVDNFGTLSNLFRYHSEETRSINHYLREARAMEAKLREVFADRITSSNFRAMDVALDWAERLAREARIGYEISMACADRLWSCRQQASMLCPADIRQRKLTEWMPKKRIRKTRKEQLGDDELEELVLSDSRFLIGEA